jgi:stage II sporulation protein D
LLLPQGNDADHARPRQEIVSMKRLIFLAPMAVLLAACSGSPAPRTTPSPTPAPSTSPSTPSSTSTSSSPNALMTAQVAPRTIVDPRIRVGLLSDQTSVVFPRTNDGYFLVGEKGTWTLRRGFTMSSPLSDTQLHYGVQAGAISDSRSATAFADKIHSETQQRVDAVFDPAGGLYKIIVGDFTATAAAQPLREQLVAKGYGKDMLIVRRPTDQPFEKIHQLVDDEGQTYRIEGQSLLVLPMSGDTVTIDQKPYRTAARVFINPRGLLNVINELNLEDYLQGVVPAEMGSKIYDELEALKAQAIAARTYAVRNMNQFGSEGYDICPGPACQAYKGFSGEEALSTQAVKATTGQVMTYDGKLIDALYTATCGGETSDVSTMFPGRNEPYLKRARCVEMEMTSIDGRADSGLLTEQQMNARLFAALASLPENGSSWSARDVEAAVTAALRLIGVDSAKAPSSASLHPINSADANNAVHPQSSRRGDVLTYLAHVSSLDQNARVLTIPEDRKYFFPESGNDAAPYLAAAFLIKFGVMPAQDIDRLDLNAPMPREELYALLASWVRKHEMLKETTGKIASIDGRVVGLKAEGKVTRHTIPAGIPIFRRIGDRYQEYRKVPVMLGDRGFLQQNSRGTIAAMIVAGSVDGAAFDRTSSFSNWTRSYRADELVTYINKRTPIKQLAGIRPTVIDASQRIAEMEFTAEGGRTFTLKGLPIRWSLNVPDNLFVFEKTTDPDGMDRYTFFGKGWGHGTGFCQVGAYGMAFRGWTAEQILKRYYTGIEIVPMERASGKI